MSGAAGSWIPPSATADRPRLWTAPPLAVSPGGASTTDTLVDQASPAVGRGYFAPSATRPYALSWVSVPDGVTPLAARARHGKPDPMISPLVRWLDFSHLGIGHRGPPTDERAAGALRSQTAGRAPPGQSPDGPAPIRRPSPLWPLGAVDLRSRIHVVSVRLSYSLADPTPRSRFDTPCVAELTPQVAETEA